MLLPILENAIDVVIMLQSRTLRWILLTLAFVAFGLEVAIVITGYWPNIGSAPAGTGCRYWTGTELVQRQEFDPVHCPLHIQRPAQRLGQK